MNEDLGEHHGVLTHLLPEDHVILDEGLREHHGMLDVNVVVRRPVDEQE